MSDTNVVDISAGRDLVPVSENVEGNTVLDEAARRRAWLKRRQLGVGASEVAGILGVDPRRGATVIYANKVAEIQAEDLEPEDDEDDPMFWGREFEDPVARWYGRKTGRTVINPGAYATIQHPKLPILFATPDRKIIDAKRGEGDLECKAVSVFGRPDLWGSAPPLWYQVQHAVQLACSGHEWGSIAAILYGTKPVYFDLERNDKFIAAMLRAVEQFWERVERRDPPPPDGTAETREALRRLWPKDSGRTITLPDEVLPWVADYDKAREAEKAATSWKEECEEQIKAAMQDATVAHLPNAWERGSFQWKVEPRSGYTVEPCEPRVFRRLKAKKKAGRRNR